MNFPTRVLGFTLLCSLTLAGCDDDDDNNVLSDTVSTGQIYATFQVVSDGNDEVFVEAQLTKGVPPTQNNQRESFVRLVDGDQLWLSTGEDISQIDLSNNVFDGVKALSDTQVRFEERRTERESYRLSFLFLFDRVILSDFGDSYSAELPNTSSRFRISFLRDDSRNATDSFVDLAEPFSVVSPSVNSRFSRSRDDIMVEWDNTDSESSVEIAANVSCPNGSFYEYTSTIDNDTGMFVIGAGTLDQSNLQGICSTTLNVRKVRTGQFDPRFIGGAVNSYQVRRVVFNLES